MPAPMRLIRSMSLVLACTVGAAGCAMFSEKETPEQAQANAARGLDTLTRTAASIADEVLKRANGDKQTPIVLGRGLTSGERALAEVVGTQLIARGATVEATCGATCLEMSIIELAGLSLSDEQKQLLSAGDILQVASSATPFLGQITRVTSERSKPAAAIVMFVTLSKREGARYTERQQFITRIGGTPIAAGEPPAMAASAAPNADKP